VALRLEDKWVWDFWFAQDGPDYHLFYLQAPRTLAREELRHWHVSIGHAVSQDLRRWTILPDALHPQTDQPDAFDSYTTWTGSIIRHAGVWHLFYTGGSLAEHGLVQRIGLATSTDLVHWQRHPANPLIAADPQWYELLDLTAWHDQAWRDPWVFQHPHTGDFHAFITARAKDGPADARGVIAHARSADLVHWEVLPPVTAPGEFGHMEVPQVVPIGGRYYLLFSVAPAHFGKARLARLGDAAALGTHYLMADDPLGEYRFLSDTFLIGDGLHYSARFVEYQGQWHWMAFQNLRGDGVFLGEISDPAPVYVRSDGTLTLTREEPSIAAP
jgi:beta-fructofuranosidase